MGPEKVNSDSTYTLVLDTSVFLSAVLFRGPTSRIVSLWQTGRISVLMSAEVLKEYARVLAYPKFKLSSEEIQVIIEQELLPYITPVRINKIVPVIRQDPSDDKFLALAAAGKADYILSGDGHLLNLASYAGVQILRPDEFLSRFSAPPEPMT
ncbi:MAG: putative toxin-antitoxin system toxin component, PIN family [Candidatus Aminicenantes bacterium]|nr:putative toxin-antitoxin system toxin component, PIN family [Candidatus Aminicenantes bacterium]